MTSPIRIYREAPTGLIAAAQLDGNYKTAYDNAISSLDFFGKYGRNGWDNKGSELKIAVDIREHGAPLNNAYWDAQTGFVLLGTGDGQLFDSFAKSKDVLLHEISHAVIDSEVRLPYIGQSGAVHESFADVFVMVASGGDTRIAEDVFTPFTPDDELRDLRKPLMSHYDQMRGSDMEPHLLSGIPSAAAVKVSDALGVDALGKIWYTALTEKLTMNSGFSGTARATIRAAEMLYGDGKEAQAVRDAWDAVGVKPRF